MKRFVNKSFVTTIKDRCRVCFTCVRECPAKAIRIVDGQAEIIGERCINCGNCVKVCSQGAKQSISTIYVVDELLASEAKVAACIAPSFPAEFADIDPAVFVGMVKQLGFDSVIEVAFGADLVAKEYRKLLDNNGGHNYIATTCPAIVTYIEKYQPELIKYLAPIVSPMIAAARALKALYSDDLKIVFIGPCIAKKKESISVDLHGDIDVAITFIELREMFEKAGITPGSAEPSTFDPPQAGYGAMFSVSRGLLQAAHIEEDLVSGEVVTADGRKNFVDALKEFESGDLDVRLLEILCCNGCIMGAGMSTQYPLFKRRAKVSEYVRKNVAKRDWNRWAKTMKTCEEIDLKRVYTADDQRIPVSEEDQIKKILAGMGKFSREDELNCGACGYDTCREHAIAIYKHLAESEMCLPYTIEQYSKTIKELAVSNEQLSTAREALMHSEKLATMGQIAAGIAHEVNNPLGVVLMYSHILLDEYSNDPALREDLAMIAEHANRSKKIVAGLLGFARQNEIVPELTDLKELVENCLSTLTPPDKVAVKTEHKTDDSMANIDRDQIIQVVTNLISNAYAAMQDGGILEITTDGDEQTISIKVSDTGTGIPKENLDKIFEPFFTTKQLGKGTGLGLSVSYGIVKMHNGDITVKSNSDPEKGQTGTTFTVCLPRKNEKELNNKEINPEANHIQ